MKLRKFGNSGLKYLHWVSEQGTINADTEFDKTDGRSFSPRFKKENGEANQALVDLVVSLEKEKNATPSQIALSW